jgi:hypothetical protein
LLAELEQTVDTNLATDISLETNGDRIVGDLSVAVANDDWVDKLLGSGLTGSSLSPDEAQLLTAVDSAGFERAAVDVNAADGTVTGAVAFDSLGPLFAELFDTTAAVTIDELVIQSESPATAYVHVSSETMSVDTLTEAGLIEQGTTTVEDADSVDRTFPSVDAGALTERADELGLADDTTAAQLLDSAGRGSDDIGGTPLMFGAAGALAVLVIGMSAGLYLERRQD